MPMEREYHTPAEAFVDMCQALLVADTVEPRGMSTTELLDVTLHIDDPMSIPFDVENRNLNFTIAALEMLQLIGQTPADSLVRRANKSLAAFQDVGISYGNYGARLRGQLTNVVKELLHDESSRRAVVTIYDGRGDLGQRTLDIPCTLGAQFLIRDGTLHTRVSMRSNDAWLGLPYDLMQFCALHCALADVLTCDVGRYTHTVGSMHLYERNWEDASSLGEALSSTRPPAPSLFMLDRFDSLARLEELTRTCQDILDNVHEPATRFERWLIAEVHGG
jgi:thymidylate synthase